MQAMLRIQNSSGEPVLSVDDWLRLAPPKGGQRQWKDGRSAKELAKAWFRRGSPAVPEELTELFATCPATQRLRGDLAIPEAVTRLDDFPGEHRNHDLVLHARQGESPTLHSYGDGARPILIGVEAKADEPFGSEPVGQYLKRTRGTRSNAPKRITELCQALFGRGPEAVADLRYQLLTAVSGTLIEARARHADLAIFLVHEFVTPATVDERHAANAADLDRFVAALGGGRIMPGELAGPFSVPGGRSVPSGIPILIGKACAYLR